MNEWNNAFSHVYTHQEGNRGNNLWKITSITKNEKKNEIKRRN